MQTVPQPISRISVTADKFRHSEHTAVQPVRSSPAGLPYGISRLKTAREALMAPCGKWQAPTFASPLNATPGRGRVMHSESLRQTSRNETFVTLHAAMVMAGVLLSMCTGKRCVYLRSKSCQNWQGLCMPFDCCRKSMS